MQWLLIGIAVFVGVGFFIRWMTEAEPKEIRKIVSVGTAAGLAESNSRSPFRRPVEPGTPTTVWQPLPDGPVITIPVGSTLLDFAGRDTRQFNAQHAR